MLNYYEKICKFVLYFFVIRVKTKEMNNLAVYKDRAGASMPVVPRPQGTACSRREGEGNSQKTVPSFLVLFNGDEVTISSGRRAGNSPQGEQFSAQAPVPQNAGTAQLRNAAAVAAVGLAGTGLSSESVRNTRSFGPYDIQANRYAMQRYREASSFRACYTSTFETTA